MAGEIINKIAESGIITLDLEHYYPKAEVVDFDLKPFLFMEMIVKEKDFRAQLKDYDWASLSGKIVAVHCSVDTLIPNWAYMLIASYLDQIDCQCYMADMETAIERSVLENIQNSVDAKDYVEKRVVIKGCGAVEIPSAAYFAITKLLQPVVKSLMYGEPCSTVPVYKKKA